MRYKATDRPDQIHADLSRTCFACGRTADAMWQGVAGLVEVCAACAVSTLPKLIADALPVRADREMGSYSTHLDAVQAAYWRGVAARLAHEKRVMRGEFDGVSEDGAPPGPSGTEG